MWPASTSGAMYISVPVSVCASGSVRGKAEIGDPQRLQSRRLHQRPAAEVGHFDLPAAAGLGRHQDVGGFEVLMQHADAMRGGHRLGRFNQQRQPGREGIRSSPPWLAAHSSQVLPAVFAFQVEGRRVEVPLQHAHEIRPIAQRFLEETGQGDLALQPFQPDAVGGELEDAGLVGLGMLRQPDLARARIVHLADELPLLAPGDRGAGLEAKLGRRRGRRSASHCTGTPSR